jgi:hypothetical protein
MFALTLTAPAATITAADSTGRTLTGLAIPYGQVGSTSAGPLTIRPGAIKVPADLRRVKLFREHGRTTPIGYTVDHADTPAGVSMAFHVAATPDGDLALLEASEGIRDGLSVELHNVKIHNGIVTAADLVGVAQVAVPAFPGAVLTASQATPIPDTPDDTGAGDPDSRPSPGPSPADADSTPTPAGDTPDPDSHPDPETDPAAPTESETAVTVTAEASRPAPAAERAGAAGPGSMLEFAAALAPIITAAGDAGTVNAALTDITPPNTGDPGGAFLRPTWLGELWTPRRDARHFLNVFSGPALTGMTWEGWKWEVMPTVDTYAGNKTAIPTSPATIVPATGEATRIAGGWDVDRIYEDFNTGFIAALLEAATYDYGQKSEAALAATLLAEATDAGAATTVGDALIAVASQLSSVGAVLSTVAMASDLFAAFLGMPVTDVPWWLTKQSTVTLSGDGSTDVAGIVIDVIPTLPAGTLLGADKNAVDFRETGPFRVQALNIPNGGIDVALFGYQGQIVRDARGIAKSAVAAAPLSTTAPAARTSK